jgi:hypothetical protein
MLEALQANEGKATPWLRHSNTVLAVQNIFEGMANR